MFCRSRVPSVLPVDVNTRALYAGPEVPAGGLKKVFGTWDFKWPQGTRIRVAFQRFGDNVGKSAAERESLLQAYIDKAIPLAEKWCVDDEGVATANIGFHFLTHADEYLPAPGQPHAAQCRDSCNTEYDVLVSFAPLPAIEPNTPEKDGETYSLPRSQLGCYAKRVDLGVPTAYLGRPEYLAARNVSEMDYRNSEQFAHCVVHEFGHVLGLGHEHQNPRMNPAPSWRTPQDIASIFSQATGIPSDPALVDFARSEVVERWPAAVINGQIRFSDWRDVQGRADGLYNFDSVMVDPLWSCYLQSPGTPNVAGALAVAFQNARPSAGDLAHLAGMYPLL